MNKDEKRVAIELVIKELTVINADVQKEVDSLSGDDSTWRQRYELCSIIVHNTAHITTLQKALNPE